VALGVFIITFFVSKYSVNAVAGYGIATRIEQLFLLPLIGLNIATLTLVGQNNGAKKFSRVKETVLIAIRYGISIIIIGDILMFIFAKLIMSLFTKDAIVISAGAQYLKIAVFVSIAYVLLYMIVSALQGLKKPMFSLYIGLYRQILAPAVVFGLALYVFKTGLAGIWWGILIINWTAAVIAVFYIRKIIKKLPGT
jgi:Na+-driven multidrug efflux pump